MPHESRPRRSAQARDRRRLLVHARRRVPPVRAGVPPRACRSPAHDEHCHALELRGRRPEALCRRGRGQRDAGRGRGRATREAVPDRAQERAFHRLQAGHPRSADRRSLLYRTRATYNARVRVRPEPDVLERAARRRAGARLPLPPPRAALGAMLRAPPRERGGARHRHPAAAATDASMSGGLGHLLPGPAALGRAADRVPRAAQARAGHVARVHTRGGAVPGDSRHLDQARPAHRQALQEGCRSAVRPTGRALRVRLFRKCLRRGGARAAVPQAQDAAAALGLRA
mmetsp:Transcript_39632/g.97984  ORF Transcript_39632/g.97984 Transcript_39632/m.97984 type:complete len:286 (-) Transcript_39632:1144-2001(-)